MTAPQGERAGFRAVTIQEPESQPEPIVVEWAAEHVDPCRTTIRVNGSNPITLPTGTGEGSHELRFKVGNSSVSSAILDRVTGGFNSKGVPRRALAKFYFTQAVEVVVFNTLGKAIKRQMPLIQVFQPALGDEVHILPAVKGVRSHYQGKARVRQQAQTAALIEQVQLQGAVMREQNAAMREQNVQVMELMAKMLVLSEPPRAEPPFDPGTMSVPELSAKLGDLTEGELELVMLAELRGERRGTAVDVIKRAFGAQDMRKEKDPSEAEDGTAGTSSSSSTSSTTTGTAGAGVSPGDASGSLGAAAGGGVMTGSTEDGTEDAAESSDVAEG